MIGPACPNQKGHNMTKKEEAECDDVKVCKLLDDAYIDIRQP